MEQGQNILDKVVTANHMNSTPSVDGDTHEQLVTSKGSQQTADGQCSNPEMNPFEAIYIKAEPSDAPIKSEIITPEEDIKPKIESINEEKPILCQEAQSSLQSWVGTEDGANFINCFQDKGVLPPLALPLSLQALSSASATLQMASSNDAQTGIVEEGCSSHKAKKSKLYSCTLCSYQTNLKQHLTSHFRTHTGEKPYKCHLCPYRSFYNSSLRKHQRTHTGEKPYTCRLCSFRASTISIVNTHFRRAHTTERPYQCTHCVFSAASGSDLKTHLRIHTGERPFKCAQCLFTATTSSNLWSHVRAIHSNEKPFKCAHCDFRGATRPSIISHSKTHTGDKPHKCNLCKFRSVNSSDLKIHSRIHTGEKPFQCDLCAFKSSKKSALRKHAKIHDTDHI